MHSRQNQHTKSIEKQNTVRQKQKHKNIEIPLPKLSIFMLRVMLVYIILQQSTKNNSELLVKQNKKETQHTERFARIKNKTERNILRNK